MTEPPQETAGREDYYNAALVEITLLCRACEASLDPDRDLGAGRSFASEGYYILLGDEAFRLGWAITGRDNGEFLIHCPACAAKRKN